MAAIDAEVGSVVSTRGSESVSLIRTRHASARLIGKLAYFCNSFSTDSRSSFKSKIGSTARRCSRALSTGIPRAPTRRNASDNTTSEVRQGGAYWVARVTAHGDVNRGG